jgi:hypothetical protein
MAAVNLLESNWVSIQEIFELASRVLTRIFAGFWPKQKADVPAADLKKLAMAFNTPKDPILLKKSRSVKRGAERAIALTYVLIRLKRIYNFGCSMLVFTPFAYCFVTLRGTFLHFLELTY